MEQRFRTKLIIFRNEKKGTEKSDSYNLMSTIIFHFYFVFADRMMPIITKKTTSDSKLWMTSVFTK